ncbi:MAG: Holliday junction resolvase RuvX [Culicoidibacterales bacterium]
MRVLGLDLGTKTVGVAVSDTMGWTAQGVDTLRFRSEQYDVAVEAVMQQIATLKPERIVIGMPKNMNGTIGHAGERTKMFAALLAEKTDLPIVFWDERLSSIQAERMLIEADLSRKKRKQVIDKMAAVVILKSYLDSL